MPTAVANFAEMLAYLNQHTDYEKQQGGRTRDTFDLERMTEVLNRLARPDLSYASAHIAGTKGKGSTSRYLAALLQSQGLKVGLFTSPHLERLTQRIEINGQEISEARMVQAFQPIVDTLAAEKAGDPDMTFFELLTLTAMVAFQQAEVDVAVFEVGLGGRLDSTNVIQPLVSVITEIGIDHTRQLGDTIEEIAREKAGIIKPGIPVICGTNDPVARRVISYTARDMEAPLLEFGKDYAIRWLNRKGRDIVFTADILGHRYEDVVIHNPARHMAENAAHALCALEVIAGTPDLFPEGVPQRERLLDALTRTDQPGRFEVFEGRPLLVIDSSHNEISLKSAVQTARTVSPGKVVLVCGMAADKDLESCTKVLAEAADAAVFTPYYSVRNAKPEDLLRLYEKFGGKLGSVEEHPEAALEEALVQAGEDGLVLVTGSTYLAGLLRPSAVEYAGS